MRYFKYKGIIGFIIITLAFALFGADASGATPRTNDHLVIYVADNSATYSGLGVESRVGEYGMQILRGLYKPSARRAIRGEVLIITTEGPRIAFRGTPRQVRAMGQRIIGNLAPTQGCGDLTKVFRMLRSEIELAKPRTVDIVFLHSGFDLKEEYCAGGRVPFDEDQPIPDTYDLSGLASATTVLSFSMFGMDDQRKAPWHRALTEAGFENIRLLSFGETDAALFFGDLIKQ